MFLYILFWFTSFYFYTTVMGRDYRVPDSRWRVRDCGMVTASRTGAIGALWLDDIRGVRVVADKLGRDALELTCTMMGTAHVALAEYLPAGVLPPPGLAGEIATAWARTKADMDALVRCNARSGGL